MKKLSIYYFLFLYFLLLIFCSGVIDSQDGFLYTAVARNIYYKGQPTAPYYKDYDDKNPRGENKNIPLNVYEGKDGKSYTSTGLGFSLALVPAVAFTDAVYKIYHVISPVHFPLENDWLILLTASFTNAFFGAALGVIIFLYLLELKLTKTQSLFFSLISIFTTNLFVYTKHINAHMMFTLFLFLSFYLIKVYSSRPKKILLYFTGMVYGIVMISYNMTFILSLPALLLYYLMLVRNRQRDIRNFFLLLSGLIPFILLFFWYEILRQEPNRPFGGEGASDMFHSFTHIPLEVFFEGLFGQLLSPGRSIFLYSPLLLILLFFWHKIKKNILPELIIFLLLTFIYIFFYSAFVSFDPRFDKAYFPMWPGESSWGPRYLLPLIPFGMLLVGNVYIYLSKKTKIFIFVPLTLFGIYMNVLGIIMPYQIKFHDLEKDFYINGQQYVNALYINLLPRYSPILSMPKNLIKLSQNFPKTLDHGIYNVHFYDGIDFPFNVGIERWRVIEGRGYIFFDNNQTSPVKELTFGLINHPIAESSQSAKIQFTLNGKNLLEEPYKLDITQRALVKMPVSERLLKIKNNNMVVEVDYGDPAVIAQGKQILGFLSFNINGLGQNLESLDTPYVSDLGPKLTGVKYQNWGGTNQDPWRFWDLHTQIYERTPDFWWIKPFYYWDLPKTTFVIGAILNVVGVVYFGYKLKKSF